MNKACMSCMKTDWIVYTSYPAKVRCIVDNSFHDRFDSCDSWTDVEDPEYCKFSETDALERGEAHWISAGWDGDLNWQIDGRGNCWRLWRCSHCFTDSKKASRFCPECGFEMTEMPEVEDE